MSNVLSKNPNLFFHVHKEENGEVSEVSIDFHSILSFCKTEESDGSVELAVKFINESKALYSFYEVEPYERFLSEYNAFVDSRNSIVAVAREMAKDIAREMKEENKKVTENIVSETVDSIRSAVRDEISDFRSEIQKQANNIIETALKHQKDINNENELYLSNMKDMQKQSNSFVNDIKEFSDRLEGITRVLDLVAPSSKSARIEENMEKEDIKSEITSM